jgi:hypothetical protein
MPADAAPDEVVDGDAVAGDGRFDSRRLLDDDAGDFVARGQREARPSRIFPVMGVRVADPGRADLDEDLAGGGGRIGELFVAEALTRGTKSNGAHGRMIAGARPPRAGRRNFSRSPPLGFFGGRAVSEEIVKTLAGFVVPLFAAAVFAVPPEAHEPGVTIAVAPARVYVERTPDGQYVSCDFFFSNPGKEPFEITDIRAKAFDAAGTLLAWRKIDSNGSRPSVEVLGPRRVEPGGTLTVFNPFDDLHAASPIDRIVFEFRLRGGKEEIRRIVEVRPVVFAQKTRLILPVPGATLFAYDGPGLYSHHRRLDVNEPFNRDIMKIRENSQRYALDLVVLDRSGEPFHGDPRDQKSWAGFGHPIVAPGRGTVVEAVGDLPDEIPYDDEVLKKNPALMAGNHVMIDHGNGEVSFLAHFRSGSLRVRAGQKVESGEVLGEMGHSGMGSGLIHVHYELRDGSDLFNAEGLPARFDGFRRAGDRESGTGRVEAGAIVITEPVRPSAR